MKKLPFSLRILRGAIGRSFVVKHYRFGIVVTKYPNMLRVKPSQSQLRCRQAFREATAFARAVFQDPLQKQAWQKRLGNPRHLFQAIIKVYFQRVKTSKKPLSLNVLPRPAGKISSLKSKIEKASINEVKSKNVIRNWRPAFEPFMPANYKEVDNPISFFKMYSSSELSVLRQIRKVPS